MYDFTLLAWKILNAYANVLFQRDASAFVLGEQINQSKVSNLITATSKPSP
jgi:hypothetical protein